MLLLLLFTASSLPILVVFCSKKNSQTSKGSSITSMKSEDEPVQQQNVSKEKTPVQVKTSPTPATGEHDPPASAGAKKDKTEKTGASLRVQATQEEKLSKESMKEPLKGLSKEQEQQEPKMSREPAMARSEVALSAMKIDSAEKNYLDGLLKTKVSKEKESKEKASKEKEILAEPTQRSEVVEQSNK